MYADKITVALVGAGAIASRRHIPEFLSNPYVEAVVLADREHDRVHKTAKAFGIQEYVWGDNAWESLVTDPRISAVCICTPNVLHAPIALMAATHGKHVLVEKPMATTVEDADRMINVANEHNVILMVGHHRRLQGCYRLAKSLLASGWLGKPKSITATLKQPGPVEWAPGSTWFYQDVSSGGGVLFDIGIHMADIVTWYMNMVPITVKVLVSGAGTFTESALCIGEFENESTVVLDVSWGTTIPQKGVTVHCERGAILVDEYAAEPVKVLLSYPFKTEAVYPVPKPELNSVGESNLGVVDHFVDCIFDRAEPLAPPVGSRDALAFVVMALDALSSEKNRNSNEDWN